MKCVICGADASAEQWVCMFDPGPRADPHDPDTVTFVERHRVYFCDEHWAERGAEWYVDELKYRVVRGGVVVAEL